MVKKRDFFGRDVVSIEDFSTDEINYILEFASEIEKNPRKVEGVMAGKMVAPLFFEPSTRTSISFQAAAYQMGGSVLDFDVYTSSIKKGETLRDTVKIIQGNGPNVVVIRHRKDGSARFVSDILDMPVINAGDGQNQHPTQTLLDLYTIKEIRGKLENIKIAIAGDLKYGRTPHSLTLALSRYNNCEMFFISHDSLKMPQDLLKRIKEKGVIFSEHGLNDLEDIINKSEILYMTRVQRERFPEGLEGEQEYGIISEQYHLTLNMLKNVKQGFKILHPLPKITEIEDRIDSTNYAHYFEQAKNGLYIRKALLYLLTNENG